MKKAIVIKRVLVCIAAAAVLMTALSGCGASKWLDENLAYATEKVSDYAHFEARASGVFSTGVFGKAYAAAMMLNDQSTEEDYANIVRYLDLDSITVADDSREVIASYPQDEKGKKVKDLGDKAVFLNIIKKNAPKQMTDPVKDEESGEYHLYAGVTQTDGSGAVIIEMTTADYADVCGETLAEKCGRNTLVFEGDTVISSTVNGVNVSDTAEKLGIADEIGKDSFTLTADGITYQCKAAKVKNYTIVCAEAA